MKYLIDTREPWAAVSAVEAAILQRDPSAVVDIDPHSGDVRVATALDEAGLVAQANQAGLAITRAQVRPLPSDCCGGCSG